MMILFEGEETGLREGIWSAYYLIEEEDREKQSEMRYVALIAFDERRTTLLYLKQDGHQHYSAVGVAGAVLKKALDEITPREILELLSISENEGTPSLYYVGKLEKIIGLN